MQKDLSRKIAIAENSDVYLFDEVDFFRNASPKMHENIKYLEESGKYAVLSMAAQKVMKTSNEYSQLVTNTDNISTDSIGVRYLLGSALECQIGQFRDGLLKQPPPRCNR